MTTSRLLSTIGGARQARAARSRRCVLHAVAQWLVVFALAQCSVGTVDAAASRPVSPCSNACTCSGPPGGQTSVDGAAVMACILRGRPVALTRVNVKGRVDLSRLPCTPLGGRVNVPGVKDPRDGLGLIALERKTGRTVPGGRLVNASISIVDSVLEGPVQTAAETAKNPGYCPVIFLQTVTLDGTTFKQDVDLADARFRRPVKALAAVFQRSLDVRAAGFADNAQFTGSTFREALADEAEFERAASFERIEVTEQGSFKSVVFRGDVSFNGVKEAEAAPRVRNMSFIDARFLKDARFEAAQFSNSASFNRARFESGAWFGDARFLGSADFEGAQFSGRAAFTGAIFGRPASFLRSVFESKVGTFFGRVEFKGEAQFQEARFLGPSEFSSATFSEGGRFLNVVFADIVDFREATFHQTAEFGDRNTRTVFGGPASFAFAKIAIGNFEDARFKGPANFAGTRFGEPAPCPKPPRIVVNMWGTSFDGIANFQDAEFRGGVNLSHATLTPGQARLRWQQLDGVVQSDSVILDIDSDCNNQRRFKAAASRSAMPRADVFAWLERNFRSLERLRDANAALYNKEEEETTAALAKTHSRWTWTGLWLWRGFYGWTSGYGVFPGRVTLILLGALLVFAAVYLVAARKLRLASEAARVALHVPELPWQDARSPTAVKAGDDGAATASTNAPTPAEEPAAPAGRPGPGLLLALAVSTAALVSIRIRGAYINDDSRWRIWWFVVGFERLVGYALLVLFALAVSRAVPGVEKFFSWLL